MVAAGFDPFVSPLTLVRKEEGEQRDNLVRPVNGLRAFSREMEENGDGLGFLGGGRLSSPGRVADAVSLSVRPFPGGMTMNYRVPGNSYPRV